MAEQRRSIRRPRVHGDVVSVGSKAYSSDSAVLLRAQSVRADLKIRVDE